ncbi:MAG TPA: MarR family transcriptional regulator [Polyangiaceae bacterium]|nr:MarR family transcriptional regulator [Polyangiaceae bacterium]
MKRAHLGWERLGRKFLKEFTLTPARYDLLNTIVDCEANDERMTQAELWKRLGVVRSAVCEMVKELVEKSILTRERAADSRTWIVRLTNLGKKLQREAYAELNNNGIATQWADSLMMDRKNIDPMPVRYQWTQTFFSIGADLGNRVRRNQHLYTWDIEELYTSLIAPEDGETWGDVPWMDEDWIAANSIEIEPATLA